MVWKLIYFVPHPGFPKDLNTIIKRIVIKEVIILVTSSAYKITGLVVLMVGALFFLRDLGVNYIGNTSGWTIIIVLVGAALLAGDFQLNKIKAQKKK